MSHYTHHKKVVLGVDDKVMMLALYSDSSVTSSSFSRKGKRFYYHPKSWCVITLNTTRLLIPKTEFVAYQKQTVEQEFQRINSYREKYENDNTPATLDDYCYSGDVFPGGGKIKHKRAFYSVKKVINSDEFLKENPILFTFEVYDSNYNTIKDMMIMVSSEEDLLFADQELAKMKAEYAQYGICIRVSNLDEENP